MALNGSRGFIYTLEAIIAATLFLTTVTVLMPEDAAQPDTETVQDSVYSTLVSLDRAGQLRDNLSTVELEQEIAPYIPAGYNHSVRVTELATDTKDFSSPSEHYFDRSGEHTEMQLWLEEADNLYITFQGEEVVTDRDSRGYLQIPLNGSQGWLNFTGSGTGEFDFDVYSKRGDLPDRETALAVSYIVAEENLTEIKVFLWGRG